MILPANLLELLSGNKRNLKIKLYLSYLFVSTNFVFAPIAHSESVNYAVEIVDYFSDYKVEIVDYFADEKWEVIGGCSNFPNLKVEIVDYFADKKVEIVDYFADKKVCITNPSSLDSETRRKLGF